MVDTKRTEFIVEVNINKYDTLIQLQCGLKIPGFILLEDIWQKTGCDMDKEKGTWICDHCYKKYFFYLYS